MPIPIKEARRATGLSQSKAAKYLGMPIRTLQQWEQGNRTPASYVEKLIIEKLNSYKKD